MVPEGSRNGASSERNACKATRLHQITPGAVFVDVARPFWTFPGTRRDSQNALRIDFSPEKSGSKRVFSKKIVQVIVLHAFATILHRFSRKFKEIVLEKTLPFLITIACFSNIVTLTKHRIL